MPLTLLQSEGRISVGGWLHICHPLLVMPFYPGMHEELLSSRFRLRLQF